MESGWTTSPAGGDYRVIAGAASRVDSPLADSPSARDYVARWQPSLLFWRWVGGLLRWRGRGMVSVQRMDQRWVWVTRSTRDAYAAAAVVADLIESGGWNPETMPQPVLPGATLGPYG